MRSLVMAVLLSSCAAEEPRRTPQTRTWATSAAVEARPAAAPAAAAPGAAAPDVAPATAAIAAAPAAADPRVAARRTAHAALVEHCGECHEGHRTTAKPAALAIFDLDLPDWPARFDDERSEVALQRLAKRPAARDAFLAFRAAERAAVRAPGG